MKKNILIATLLCIAFSETMAQKQKPYTLFNPVPKDKMRELSTDRPDITESPYSVDAGHFQVESDLFKTTRTPAKGIQDATVENNYNLANLKLGLTKNIDLQLVVGSYVNSYEKDNNGNKVNEISEFGDMTLRLKYNLWGNDAGKSAFAMMPYVNFPTSKSNHAVEAGIVFPFALDLGNDFNFGTQAQFDLLKSTSKSGYHGGILQSATVGKAIVDDFDVFIESYYNYDFESKKVDVSFNGGANYLLSKNLKLDAGFNLGLTKNTANVYFIGFSFRY